MQRVLTLLTIISSVLLLSACGNKTYIDPLADGVLTVGMECAYEPYNWREFSPSETNVPLGNNTYCEGYDVQIAKIMAEKLGVKLEIKALNFEALIQNLQTKQIDAIIAGMSPTPERSKTINFTDIYYTTEQVMVIRKDSPYKNATAIEDFAGANVSAQLGTLQVDLLDQLIGANKTALYKSYPLLVNALTATAIDGFVAELPVAHKIVNSNPNLMMVAFAEGKGFKVDPADVATAIGLRKADQDLLEKLNQALAEISLETRNEWMNYYTELASKGTNE